MELTLWMIGSFHPGDGEGTLGRQFRHPVGYTGSAFKFLGSGVRYVLLSSLEFKAQLELQNFADTVTMQPLVICHCQVKLQQIE